MRRFAAGLLLAACSVGAGDPAPRAGVSFSPDANGLAVPVAGQRIDFGRSPKGVIPVMDREVGAGRALGVGGCPGGVVRQIAWGDLILSFTRERFVGWRNDVGQAGQICAG